LGSQAFSKGRGGLSEESVLAKIRWAYWGRSTFCQKEGKVEGGGLRKVKAMTEGHHSVGFQEGSEGKMQLLCEIGV